MPCGVSQDTSSVLFMVSIVSIETPTETPHFGILKSPKEPLRGLTARGSQLSQSAELDFEHMFAQTVLVFPRYLSVRTVCESCVPLLKSSL